MTGLNNNTYYSLFRKVNGEKNVVDIVRHESLCYLDNVRSFILLLF